MRNILFRGKRKDTGEWVYGAYGNHTSLDAMIIDRPYPAADGDLSALGFWPVHPDTVGQYTGLIDKNGVEIFEGDILLFDFEDIGKQKAIVEWCQKYTTYQLRPLDNFKYVEMSEGTVIGNIHDTPELLEAKK